MSCDGLIPEQEVVDEFVIGPHRRRKPSNMAAEPVESMDHTINLIDLDFNGHTNNRRYIQMALACFKPGFIKAYRPDMLNIRFIHESLMGDTVRTATYPSDVDNTFIGVSTNGQGQELCRVTSRWREREPLPDISDFNYIRNE